MTTGVLQFRCHSFSRLSCKFQRGYPIPDLGYQDPEATFTSRLHHR